MKLFQRHIALPTDHGSWVFLLSPLLIGIFAAPGWDKATFILVVAALAAFLLRQPVTVAVKVYSGRRSKRDLPAAFFWAAIYSLAGLFALASLWIQGYGHILILALPGIPVFIWHLFLVSRRSERRQAGVEIVASGVLALAAPAAYWTGTGTIDASGWLLFGLVWLQSAASIVHAYLRLEQRELPALPGLSGRFGMARRALAYTTFNLIAVSALSLARVTPGLLPLPYALQWIETIWGALKPAIGVKPTRIGMRQLMVSTLFTLLFILTWSG